MIRLPFWWSAGTALFCLTACAQQAKVGIPLVPPQPLSVYESEWMETLALNGYKWLLLSPPERAYAAGRAAFEGGGPLATAPSEGGEFHGAYYIYSVNQIDLRAPLKNWRRIGFFQSEQECEAQKAQQLKQLSDPAWRMAQARKSRTHLVDWPRTHDMVEAERCVTATELPGKAP